MSDLEALLPANLFVDRPDGVLAAHRSGEGPLLILLHGWTLDRRVWFRLVERLAGRFTLVALDRRGAGHSDCPADLARELDDIDALLATLGGERAHVGGMSQGGRVALRYAHRRPARVISLGLFGAPLDGLAAAPDDADAIPLDHYRALLAEGRLDALAEAWLGHRLMRLGPAQADLDALCRSWARQCRWSELLAPPALAPFDVDLAVGLEKITVPIAGVVGSEESEHLRAVARFLAARAPDAVTIEIADAGHLAILTHAAEVATRYGDFLERTG